MYRIWRPIRLTGIKKDLMKQSTNIKRDEINIMNNF